MLGSHVPNANTKIRITTVGTIVALSNPRNRRSTGTQFSGAFSGGDT